MFGVTLWIGLTVGCGGSSEISRPSDPPVPPAEFVTPLEAEVPDGADEVEKTAAAAQVAPTEAVDAVPQSDAAPESGAVDAQATEQTPSGE